MSKRVHEIMNREVLMLDAEEPAEDALANLVALGVSGAIESRPVPCLPAAFAPVGEIDAATATSMLGSL